MARMTKQKQILQEEIGKSETFFSAEDLYQKIAKKDKGMGIATVYRFLKGLEESGGIHSFVCDNRKTYSISKKNHIHFECERCGMTKHLPAKNVDFLTAATGEEICHFQVNITGVCKRCQRS
jgi:Fe2+ or Zn2+ uptake regulation protein